jgi:hypothetical protein
MADRADDARGPQRLTAGPASDGRWWVSEVDQRVTGGRATQREGLTPTFERALAQQSGFGGLGFGQGPVGC